MSAYKKSSWYLKAFKSYPIFKVRDDDNNDNDNDDADIIGGWIIVRSVLTPSRTKSVWTKLPNFMRDNPMFRQWAAPNFPDRKIYAFLQSNWLIDK